MRHRSQVEEIVKDTKLNCNTYDFIREKTYEFGTRQAPQRAWVEAGTLPLLCRQRHRPNGSRHDDCYLGGRMARLQPQKMTFYFQKHAKPERVSVAIIP